MIRRNDPKALFANSLGAPRRRIFRMTAAVNFRFQVTELASEP
jgi:hypothetical protein